MRGGTPVPPPLLNSCWEPPILSLNMSQRVRKNGSPTPAGGGAQAAGGRLQPMRATVPFQLRHTPPTPPTLLLHPGGSPTRTAPPRSTSPSATRHHLPSTSSRGSPTVGTQTANAVARAGPTGSARGSPPRGQQHHPALSPCSSPVHLWPVDPSPLPVPAPPTGKNWNQRRSPEHRSSPERKSPSSPVCKVEKSRQPTSPSSIIRRTSSLDTLAAPYLSGQWPRDNHGQAAPCMRDNSTQTEAAWTEEYNEKKKGSHKRSASWGSNDQLKEIAKLRQQLQRSKHSSRHHRDKDRQSPFHGNHAAINQCQNPIPKSVLIPVTIPITKASGSRFRNSVEGLNQEIEIITKETGDKEEQLTPQDIPDGHRAPPPLVLHSNSTRNIDTQTPGGADRGSNSSSRSQSISPASFLIITNEGREESPCSADDLLADSRDKENGNNSPLPKYATSPKPNNSYMFKREPPEGCEKVKVFEESSPKPLHEIPPFYCPDKNKVNFIPKSGSAFCLVSILKPLLPTQELTFKGSNHSLSVSGMSPALVQPIALASLSTSTEQDRISRGTSTVFKPHTLLQPSGHIEDVDG